MQIEKRLAICVNTSPNMILVMTYPPSREPPMYIITWLAKAEELQLRRSADGVAMVNGFHVRATSNQKSKGS